MIQIPEHKQAQIAEIDGLSFYFNRLLFIVPPPWFDLSYANKLLTEITSILGQGNDMTILQCEPAT